MSNAIAMDVDQRPVRIRVGNDTIDGDLTVPRQATGIVVFAHGSGSSRFSRRNRAVAASLQAHGLATLLADLLTPAEEAIDQRSAQYRFDIDRLGARVIGVIDWIAQDEAVQALPIGIFGASTGAAAALVAAARRPKAVYAVVSRGGRPDLAGTALPAVIAPTLLVVGGLDVEVLRLNRMAQRQLTGVSELRVVGGATHLFEEPGAMDEVSLLAREWFERYLSGPAYAAPPVTGW
jgi:dienelactone hydrolase